MKTLLTFKTRIPQWKRRKLVATLAKLFRNWRVSMSDIDIQITHKKNDAKPIWVFMFTGCFSKIGDAKK